MMSSTTSSISLIESSDLGRFQDLMSWVDLGFVNISLARVKLVKFQSESYHLLFSLGNSLELLYDKQNTTIIPTPIIINANITYNEFIFIS